MRQFTSVREFFEHFLLGNQAAVNFNLLFRDILHTWDDLIDRDKPVSGEAIHQAFRAALVLLPANPFYRDWLEKLLRKPLEDAFSNLFGRTPDLVFQVNASPGFTEAPAGRSPATALPSCPG